MMNGWSNEVTFTLAQYWSQNRNIGAANAEAERHGPMRPHTLGTALAVMAEFARLVDTDGSQSAYMMFTTDDGRNMLEVEEINYEELGSAFSCHFIEED